MKKYYFLPTPHSMALFTISKQESSFTAKTSKGEMLSSPLSKYDAIQMVSSLMGEKEEKLLNEFIK
jgi:hypothetical protein